MSDQVSADLQTINTALTDLSTQLTTLSSLVQSLKDGAQTGAALTQEQVDLIHTLATNATQVDDAAKALVTPAAPVSTDPAQTEQPVTDANPAS